VDPPINTIFTEQVMTQYLRMFNFLWRLKRLEFKLAQSWKRQMTGVRFVAGIQGI
jgi:gamma-tubulin complex component 3